MRRQVAFDRFLMRLFHKEPSPWVLKGGCELRIQSSRATRDVDLELHKGMDSKNTVLEELRDAVKTDLGDFFAFEVKQSASSVTILPYGGMRFAVIAGVGEKEFNRFHVDVEVCNALFGPVDTIMGEDWLGFAGFYTRMFPVLSTRQHFAEKSMHTRFPGRENQLQGKRYR